MPAPNSVDDPKHWRDRAAEMRTLVAEMKSTNIKKMILRLAADYDLFAKRAEERAGPRQSK
jgi:hypothetical protein